MVGQHGAAILAVSRSPVLFAQRGSKKQFSVRAIENEEEAVVIGVGEQLAGTPLPWLVNQNQRSVGIPVVGVVRRELEVPFQLAGLDVERDDAVGVQVVASALITVEVGAGIADGPVD